MVARMRNGHSFRLTALILLGATACTYPQDADVEPVREPADVASLHAVHRDASGRFFSSQSARTSWHACSNPARA